MTVAGSLNRRIYKVVLITLRYIPITISLGYALYTILGFFGIYPIWLGNIFHLSAIPWLFIYLVSFVLRFCVYHRLPLYYIFMCDFITLIDEYIGIPITTLQLFALHLLLMLFLITVIIINYVTTHNKKSLTKDNRQYRCRKF